VERKPTVRLPSFCKLFFNTEKWARSSFSQNRILTSFPATRAEVIVLSVIELPRATSGEVSTTSGGQLRGGIVCPGSCVTRMVAHGGVESGLMNSTSIRVPNRVTTLSASKTSPTAYPSSLLGSVGSVRSVCPLSWYSSNPKYQSSPPTE
jgi:hypothetical protein